MDNNYYKRNSFSKIMFDTYNKPYYMLVISIITSKYKSIVIRILNSNITNEYRIIMTNPNDNLYKCLYGISKENSYRFNIGDYYMNFDLMNMTINTSRNEIIKLTNYEIMNPKYLEVIKEIWTTYQTNNTILDLIDIRMNHILKN